MMKERSLPIGIQDFQDLREKGFVYVDKTAILWDLVHSGKPFFLSRPRRFGKSLLLSTMKAYFQGKKELFHGLAIEELEAQLEEPWQEYPVLYFDFNGENYNTKENLENFIDSQLEILERDYGIEKTEKSISLRFSALIRGAYEKTGKQVVVLVDEYDKPLLQTQSVNPKLNNDYREILKGFYGVLKSADHYLRFVLLTGVSQFSRLSIFSDMNQFTNISTDNAYGEICGITEEELKENFKPELEQFAESNELSFEETLQSLRRKYDGYRFARVSQNLYNPFSLLEALRTKSLQNYWYATGTPTFLINLFERENFDIRDLEETQGMNIDILRNSEPNGENPIPILFQTGYLTLKKYDKEFDEFILGFPNEEVRYAFLKNLLPKYLGREEGASFFVTKFVKDVRAGRVNEFMERVSSIIADLPYSREKKTNIELRERDYQIAIYLIFTLMGQFTRTEVHGLKGRADCIVEERDRVYIFEFKLMSAGSPSDAINQIREQGYGERFRASGKSVVLVGASFDESTRNIGEWKLEEL